MCSHCAALIGPLSLAIAPSGALVAVHPSCSRPPLFLRLREGGAGGCCELYAVGTASCSVLALFRSRQSIKREPVSSQLPEQCTGRAIVPDAVGGRLRSSVAYSRRKHCGIGIALSLSNVGKKE